MEETISSLVSHAHSYSSAINLVLAPKTTFWLLSWNFSTANQKLLFKWYWNANTCNKIDYIMSKGMKNCARKRYLLMCTILFEVTFPFERCETEEVKQTYRIHSSEAFRLWRSKWALTQLRASSDIIVLLSETVPQDFSLDLFLRAFLNLTLFLLRAQILDCMYFTDPTLLAA